MSMTAAVLPVFVPEQPGAQTDQQPRPGTADEPGQAREQTADRQEQHQDNQDWDEQHPHWSQAPCSLAGSVSSLTSPVARAEAISADFARSMYTRARPTSVES